jgi:hypothetical protein
MTLCVDDGLADYHRWVEVEGAGTFAAHDAGHGWGCLNPRHNALAGGVLELLQFTGARFLESFA